MILQQLFFKRTYYSNVNINNLFRQRKHNSWLKKCSFAKQTSFRSKSYVIQCPVIQKKVTETVNQLNFKHIFQVYSRTHAESSFIEFQWPVPLQCLIEGPCNLNPFKIMNRNF